VTAFGNPKGEWSRANFLPEFVFGIEQRREVEPLLPWKPSNDDPPQCFPKALCKSVDKKRLKS